MIFIHRTSIKFGDNEDTVSRQEFKLNAKKNIRKSDRMMSNWRRKNFRIYIKKQMRISLLKPPRTVLLLTPILKNLCYGKREKMPTIKLENPINSEFFKYLAAVIRVFAVLLKFNKEFCYHETLRRNLRRVGNYRYLRSLLSPSKGGVHLQADSIGMVHFFIRRKWTKLKPIFEREVR